MKKTQIIPILFLLVLTALISCKKDFLDAKPDKSLIIPSTISDFQNLLDNYNIMNQAPYLSIVSSDDVYTTTAGYNGASTLIKNSYLWASDIYQGQVTITDWNVPYQCVYYANTVLDGLQSMPAGSASQSDQNAIKGAALFYRAMANYELAQEFTLPYADNSADQRLGIPIRLTSDVQTLSTRATLRQTYQQILSDLDQARTLLSATSTIKTRPTRASAWGLLARTYLIMGDYSHAKIAADSCINLNGKLLDYNTLTTTAARPFPSSIGSTNDEILYYHTVISVSYLTSPSVTLLDSTLYASYSANDLRQSVFFTNKGKGAIVFKGNYTGNSAVFAGIATDEIYLIRAESNARLANATAAMADLNALLIKRWKKNTFVPFSASSADDALGQILTERQKELVYRNLRWSDLKRLNQDSNYAITLTRVINGITYKLLPNDPKYAFPIPDAEISADGIQQNAR